MMRFSLATSILLSAAMLPTLASAAQPLGKVVLPPLSYTVEKSGPANGAHPKRRDTIVVNYTLALLDGRVVDSSAKNGAGPVTFPLGQLIPAWQVLIQQMRPGDAWTFYVPPEYAYGSVAREGLPANSFLVFKVELVSFAPAPPQ